MRKMKDSGIEWIGQIPSDWKVCKILYSLKMPLTDGPHTTPEMFDDGVPFVSAEAVSCGNGRIDFDHIRGYISEEFYQECCKKYIPQINDIYMIKSGATTGKVAIVDTDRKFTIWSPLAVFRSNEQMVIAKYMFYYLQSSGFQKQVELSWSFGTQQNIGMRALERLNITIPPIAEQKKIADFLDEKCGEIDSIRSDIQKQIDILNDYKKSVITEAVTKGLNPKTKLKDSGIEWIGKIPEGWNVKKLKYLCSTITDGSHFSPETTLEGKPYITVSDVYNDKIHYEEAAKISEEDFFILERNGCRPPKGAVLLSKDGTVGRTAIVFDNSYVVLSSLGILVPNLNVINSSYLKYLLDSPNLQEQMKLAMAGSALRRITISKISRFIGIVPPLSEQKAIADYLDEKCSEIDATIADKQKQLETLDEYKKSLIFEYVTGKKEVLQ